MEPDSSCSHDKDQRQGILQGELGMEHAAIRECSGRVVWVENHELESQIGICIPGAHRTCDMVSSWPALIVIQTTMKE